MSRYDPPNSGACLGLSSDGVWDALQRPVAHLPAPVEPADAATKAYVDAAVAGGVRSAFWKTDTSLVMNDPGGGRLRCNQSDMTLVSSIVISTLTNDGVDVSALMLNKLVIGDRVGIQIADDASQWATFVLTAAPVNNTTWYRLDVQRLNGAGSPIVNNRVALVAFARALVVAMLAPSVANVTSARADHAGAPPP